MEFRGADKQFSTNMKCIPSFLSMKKKLRGYVSWPQQTLQQHRSQHRLQNPHKNLGGYSQVAPTQLSLKLCTISTTLSKILTQIRACEQQAQHFGCGCISSVTWSKLTRQTSNSGLNLEILDCKWEKKDVKQPHHTRVPCSSLSGPTLFTN